MDNLGDWLYIVLLIIAGISSLLSVGKKKKRSEEVLRQPETNRIPEYLDWETTLWETMPTPIPPLKTNKETKRPAPFHSSLSTHTPLFKEGERTIAPQQTEPPLQEDIFSISGDSFQNMDELKKAVIYSEILNRKY